MSKGYCNGLDLFSNPDKCSQCREAYFGPANDCACTTEKDADWQFVHRLFIACMLGISMFCYGTIWWLS